MGQIGRAALKAYFETGDIPTEAQFIDLIDSILNIIDNASYSFAGQAHGGSSVQSFSASQTFNANNGNNQSMPVTASTNVGISNELPGTYVFELGVVSGTPTITPNANLGTVMDDSAALINADGDINIITVYVNPSGLKRYSINTITA